MYSFRILPWQYKLIGHRFMAVHEPLTHLARSRSETHLTKPYEPLPCKALSFRASSISARCISFISNWLSIGNELSLSKMKYINRLSFWNESSLLKISLLFCQRPQNDWEVEVFNWNGCRPFIPPVKIILEKVFFPLLPSSKIFESNESMNSPFIEYPTSPKSW